MAIQSGTNYFDPGLNNALAANAAMGAQGAAAQPKKGFGSFLRAFAGYLGDNLSGNQNFAQQQAALQQQQAQQAEMEAWYERKRRDELQDYEAKKRIDSGYSSPDLPGIADEYNWYSQQPPEMQSAVQDYMKMRYPQQFVPPAPVNVPYGATIEGGGSALKPGTVEDGYRFKGGNPGDPNNWEKEGGPSLGGSGGFL